MSPRHGDESRKMKRGSLAILRFIFRNDFQDFHDVLRFRSR